MSEPSIPAGCILIGMVKDNAENLIQFNEAKVNIIIQTFSPLPVTSGQLFDELKQKGYFELRPHEQAPVGDIYWLSDKGKAWATNIITGLPRATKAFQLDGFYSIILRNTSSGVVTPLAQLIDDNAKSSRKEEVMLSLRNLWVLGQILPVDGGVVATETAGTL